MTDDHGRGEVPLEDTAEDLYENAPCGYLTTLPDGTILRVNRTFLAWTGYRREDLVGTRFQHLLTPGGRIYHETHFAPLLRMQGELREIAFDVVRADRSRIPVLLNAAVHADAAGRRDVSRITIFNATDRRRYERDLLEARRHAERSEGRVRILQRLTADLAGTATVADIAGVVVRLGGEAFHAVPLMWTLDPERSVLVCADGTEALGTVPLGAPSPVAHALVTRDLVVIESSEAARSTYPQFAGLMRDRGWQGLVAVPLVVEDELGVVALASRSAWSPDDDERELLWALGRQVAQALRRARLHEETVQRARRAALLARLGNALDEVSALADRARRLAGTLVPELASRAVVDLAGVHGMHRIADSAGPPATADERDPAASRAAAMAIATGKVRWADEPSRRIVAIPLRARGATVGAVTLTADEPFHEADLPFLDDLGYRAGLALDNARLYEHEHDTANTLQRSLLTSTPLHDPRARIGARYLSGTEDLEVGGDWHDAFPVGPGKVGIVVGDVVGRGINAATAMGQLRSATRALAGVQLGPARLLEHLDRFVDGLDAARMATLVYAEIDLDTGAMRYACAGHLPPILVPPGGEPELLWDGRSMPIGIVAAGSPRVEAEVTLRPGARLLLYTDGLVENRTDPVDDGMAKLAGELAKRRHVPPATVVELLTDAMLRGRDSDDDVCLLCLDFTP